MTKTFFSFLAAAATAAVVSVAVPARAEPSIEHIAFDRDGMNFVADVTRFDNGERLIAGRETRSNRPFRLYVAKGRVTGDFDGTPVAYAAPKGAKVKPTLVASN